MDESEADYNMRCIITANQYYRDHLKVGVIFCFLIFSHII